MADDPFDGVFHHVTGVWDGLLGEANPAPPAPSTGGFLDSMRADRAAPEWEPLADEVGAQYGVPSEVARALVFTESGGDPAFQTAGGKVVGLAGEPTASFLPGEVPSDPATNLRRAFSRLAYQYGRTGDWTKAALRRYGAADAAGNPTYKGGQADGFSYAQRFAQALQRYRGGA